MSRKRCVRKVYALVNPLAYALQGAAITPGPLLDKLRLRELSAIESLRTGMGEREDWTMLADMLNLCETMATEGIGREAMPSCEAAQQALERAYDRAKTTGRIGLDGPGLQALRELYEWHDAQRTSISRAQYERLIRLTWARIRSALGRAKAGGVKVMEMKEMEQ
jgi:hypothetical protein